MTGGRTGFGRMLDGLRRGRDEARAPHAAPTLEFEYRGRAPAGQIDQALLIANRGREAVAPVLRLTPVDELGRPVPDVTVSTVYGSDRGSLVLPPGLGLDILRFDGDGRRAVSTVRVAMTSVTPIERGAASGVVEVQPVAEDGSGTDRFGAWTRFVLRNPNEVPVAVRVVYIVYDVPEAGASQQAVEVVPATGLVIVPAQGSVVEDALPEALASHDGGRAGRAVSLKAYLSH